MKTKVIVVFVALAFVALAVGCGGAGADKDSGRVTLDAVYGSSLEGVGLREHGQTAVLRFAQIPAAGKMLRLHLPGGLGLGQENWISDEATLHLSAPVTEGVEIGLVPTADYAGQEVQLELQFGSGPRAASTAPTGQANVVKDFTVTPSSLGFVTLKIGRA